MSLQSFNLSQHQQTSPLLDSRNDGSVTKVKAAFGGLDVTDDSVFPPEGPSSGVSIRLGSEQGSCPTESHSYSEIPYPAISKVNGTVPRPRYQNHKPPGHSGPVSAKCRPLPRPPPRSASESEVDTRRPVPPRTYLNNDVFSLSSTNRNPFVTDCSNEISISYDGGAIRPSRRGRQRLCVIVAFVAIFLALSLAGTAAFFSIHTYLTTRHSKQEIQETKQLDGVGVPQNQSLASAHVGLMVKNPTEAQKVTFISNYTLYLTNQKARLHYNNVNIWDRGVTIQIKGMYFVYSSIGFNINEKFLNCDKLEQKTWLHYVMLSRDGAKEIPLLRSEHTCCTGCPEFHTSGFTGGVFELLPTDNIYVRVSTPLLVFDDKESSFLGLFLIK